MIHMKILPSEFVRVTLSGVFACEAGLAILRSRGSSSKHFQVHSKVCQSHCYVCVFI